MQSLHISGTRSLKTPCFFKSYFILQLNFCSRSLSDVITTDNKPTENNDIHKK